VVLLGSNVVGSNVVLLGSNVVLLARLLMDAMQPFHCPYHESIL
jgi:hypothetical protein